VCTVSPYSESDLAAIQHLVSSKYKGNNKGVEIPVGHILLKAVKWAVKIFKNQQYKHRSVSFKWGKNMLKVSKFKLVQGLMAMESDLRFSLFLFRQQKNQPDRRFLLPVGSDVPCRTAEKQPTSIGKYEIPAYRFGCPVFRLIAFDDKHGSYRHRVYRHAITYQHIRGATLDLPADDLTIRTFHVNVEPRVRVDHFPACQSPFQRQR